MVDGVPELLEKIDEPREANYYLNMSLNFFIPLDKRCHKFLLAFFYTNGIIFDMI